MVLIPAFPASQCLIVSGCTGGRGELGYLGGKAEPILMNVHPSPIARVCLWPSAIAATLLYNNPHRTFYFIRQIGVVR